MESRQRKKKGKQLERFGWARIWKSNHFLDLELGRAIPQGLQEARASSFSLPVLRNTVTSHVVKYYLKVAVPTGQLHADPYYNMGEKGIMTGIGVWL